MKSILHGAFNKKFPIEIDSKENRRVHKTAKTVNLDNTKNRW